MLPDSAGKGVKSGFDPVISGLFAAGRAQSGFAGMRNFETMFAERTNKVVVSEQGSAACKKFEYINNNTFSDEVTMYKEEFPPVTIMEENMTKFCAGNIFHNSIKDIRNN